MRYADDAPKIPAAALSVPDAELLAHMASRGVPVRVRLKMASTFEDAVPAWNVVGEVTGSEHPDQIIVIGGHLDSWDPGQGAIDDGAGVAITSAAAKLINDLPRHPKRTIRMVMFGAEEMDYSGAAYAAAHQDEAGKIVLAIECDEGADAVWSVDLPAGTADQPGFRSLAAVLAPLKIYISPKAPLFGGADVEALMKAGAPTVDLHQDATRYFDIHHSADDTLDKIDRAQLNQNFAAWAAFLNLAADGDVDFKPAAK
jgi:Zn-dependent M28 family amino/carboxypeptidase